MSTVGGAADAARTVMRAPRDERGDPDRRQGSAEDAAVGTVGARRTGNVGAKAGCMERGCVIADGVRAERLMGRRDRRAEDLAT